MAVGRSGETSFDLINVIGLPRPAHGLRKLLVHLVEMLEFAFGVKTVERAFGSNREKRGLRGKRGIWVELKC